MSDTGFDFTKIRKEVSRMEEHNPIIQDQVCFEANDHVVKLSCPLKFFEC